MMTELKVWLAWFRLMATNYRQRRQRRRLLLKYLTMQSNSDELMWAIYHNLNNTK